MAGSALKADVGSVGKLIRGSSVTEPGPFALSDRQVELNALWARYKCQAYAGRKTDWNGHQNTDNLETEAIATAGFLPAGFYAAGDSFPLKYRKPSVPYYLTKIVVDRITGLLFSSGRHPKVTVEGDADTQEWLTGFVEDSRLWARMVMARTMGGAMGTVAIGLKFVRGKPRIEVHDARWLFPVFSDPEEFELEALEKRYTFPEEVYDEDEGAWKQKWFWYRRVITDTHDTVWARVPVPEDDPQRLPIWAKEDHTEVAHDFGFCPVVWIQNHEVQDSVDGAPDAEGAADLIAAIDCLLSQAQKGTVANCFARSTPFVTDRGVFTFGDFEPGAEVQVLTHTGARRKATVRSYGVQPLYDVTLQRGGRGAPVTMRATRGHRWLLGDGTTTDALQVGDRLQAAPGHFSSFEYELAAESERAGWRAGFIWGDGASYSAAGSRLRLCGAKTQYASRFRDGGFSVYAPETFQGDLFASHPHVAKALPDPSTTELAYLRAFARGWLDADGSKSKKASSRWRCLQVTGEASVAWVEKVFPAVGMYLTAATDMTGSATNYGARTAKTVRFGLNENASDHFNSQWRCVDIQDAGVAEEVWCLEVEGDQSFTLPCGVVTRNCDPTVLMATDGDFEEVAKGSDNAIKLEKGGTAQYLEITGAGPRTALELAKDFEDRVQKICRVVFDTNLSGPARTAAEVNRNYSSMLENADMLREQYGERGVKRLLQMAVDAGRKLRGPQEVIDADGKKTKVTRAIILSPKVELDEMGNTVPVQRRLGPGGEIKLVWPDYFDPTNLDIVQAVDAVTRALTAKLITQEQAIEFVAHYFGVEDITEVLEKGTATHELEMQKLMGKIALANAQARIPGGMVPPPGGPQPGGPANPQPAGAGPAPSAPGAPPGALSPNFGSP